MRDITLILDDSSFLELKDCHYIPKRRKNLILVSSLCKLNYSMAFSYKQVLLR